jgi:hypothetical protein
MVSKWCSLRGAERFGFKQGVLERLALIEIFREDSEATEFVSRLLREVIPDAWGWSGDTLVICEVCDTSPLTKEKLSVYGELYWVLDEVQFELIIEVVDRTETIRRVDMVDLACALAAGPDENYYASFQLKWEPMNEVLS